MTTEDLISYWRGDWKIHPDDQSAVSTHNSIYLENDARHLHTKSLTPIPWVGNLRSAAVILVMLNPGYCNEQPEYERRESQLLEDNRNQFKGCNMFCLVDNAGITSGGRYWRSIFRTFVQAHFQDCEAGYRLLAEKLCVAQMIAYHSKRDPGSKLRSSLPSSRPMLAWLRKEAQENQSRGIIIMRCYNDVGPLGAGRNVLICNNELQLRRPSFNPVGLVSRHWASHLERHLHPR
jgi:hypothetical protein